jgi:hypothetical protein
MGIDYDGGMIVGESGGAIVKGGKVTEDEYEIYDVLTEDMGMECMSMYYDTNDLDELIFGFPVPDIPVDEIDDAWLQDIKAKGAKFEELTGIKAELIGIQDIS